MRKDPYFGVHYWSQRFSQIENEELNPLRRRLHDIHVAPLTTQELLRIRSVLDEVGACSRLLAEEVASIPEREPRTLMSFLKKITKNV